MKAAPLMLALALLGPIEGIDRAVERQVQAMRTPAAESPMRELTRAGRPLVVGAGLIALAIFDPVAGVATVRGCVAVLLPVNAVVEALKWGVNRTRPDGDRKRSNSSFPSSHAANAVALAWMLTRRWPRGAVGFIALAGLVSFSRLYLDRHFLSDVVFGAGLGLVLAVGVTRRWPVLDPARARNLELSSGDDSAGNAGLPREFRADS
jgi:membrane-associated phospholipid phosphatase